MGGGGSVQGQETPEVAALPASPSTPSPKPFPAAPIRAPDLSEAFHFREFLRQDNVRLNANQLQK